IALTDHRFPGLGVGWCPTVGGNRSVKHVAVDVIGPQMLERPCHGLRNLDRIACRRIVREAMVLSRLVGKLGLQEQLLARNHTSAICGSKCLPYTGLIIVLSLVGGVDAAKARA